MNITTSKHSLRALTAAISAGVLTLGLGLSGAVYAHDASDGHRGGGFGNGHAPAVVHHHYYNEPRRHHRSKHYRRHGRDARRVVYVHNYYEPPVEVVHVYEPQSRVVLRPVEQNVAYPYSGSASQINAGSLVGAALGGLIGSQVGGGRGKLAATAAGTVGGFLLGNRATQRVR